MTEYVRIKDPATGHEYTYDRVKVEILGLGDHVITKPALGPDGRPAPPKYRMPLGTPLPGSAAERRRDQTSASKAGDSDDGPKSAANTKEN